MKPDEVRAIIRQELGAFREPLVRDIMELLGPLIELAQVGAEAIAQREKFRAAGARGGQKSGAIRREKPAQTNPPSIVRISPKTKGGSMRDAENHVAPRRGVRHAENHSEIGTNPPSMQNGVAPLLSNRGVNSDLRSLSSDGAEPVEKTDQAESGKKGPGDSNEGGFDFPAYPGTETPPLELSAPAAKPRGSRSKNLSAEKPRSDRPDATKDYEQRGIDEFHNRFRAAYGSKPNWIGGSVELMRGLVRRHGLAEVTRRMIIAFETPPTWPVPPYDVGSFAKFFDKFVVAPSKIAAPMTGAGGLTYGRFEPGEKPVDYRAPWVIEAERNAAKGTKP